jgi:hypothetical protein
MPLPSTSNAKRKHQDAINTYKKLSSETETIAGVKYKKYTDALCLAKAAYLHYLAPRTLETTLYGRGH